MPRFAPSVYSDSELLGVVRDVCRHVNRDRPVSVSETAFDAARAEAGHPQAPTAARICKRLRRGWPEVKAIALDRKRDPVQTAGQWTRVAQDASIGELACIFALQLVAGRRGGDRLTKDQYDETADIVRAEIARRRNGRIVIPTANQIVTVFKTWKAALAAANLKQPKQSNDRLRGVSYVDALERALESHGALPTQAELARFFGVALRQRLANPRNEGLTHASALDELRRRRAAATPPKWTPLGYPPFAQRPDWSAPSEPVDGPERRPELTDERIVQYLMRFLCESDRHARAAYVAWASRTAGAPAAASMSRNGRPGFAAYKAQARERLRRGGRPTS